MKAIIPCALKEDNLFPFSETQPTALMPVMGEPVVEHLIQSLRSIGVEEIHIVANHKEEMIREEYGSDSDVKVVHQDNLDGTGSAVQAVDRIEEEFFVVFGDVVVSERDLRNLKNKFENKESKASMLATGEERPDKFGVLSITNDEVDSIMEKPEEPDNTLVNTGIYIFEPEVFDVLKDLDDDQDLLVDAVSQFAEKDQATFELVEDYWIDIGDLRTLKKADRIKREFEITDTKISDSAEVHESAEITGNAVIKDEAHIKPNTVLQGDVFIGKGTDIEPNTRIKNSTICKGSIIDAQSIKQSNIFQDNIIDPGVCIEDSILGEDSEIRSGTVIRESFIGARSFIDMNNSIRDMKFVPDARTDLSEISK
jgi:bifunctional UDP-N-acetylglucosamine pyrophosphorylase/glucosamine-1-phosphate N-acetyltransferase